MIISKYKKVGVLPILSNVSSIGPSSERAVDFTIISNSILSA